MVELDKKFIQKVLTKGGVEKDVLVKRYQKYLWAMINKKIGDGGYIPTFVKKDIFQYVFVKMFDNDAKALRDYVEKYEIPFKNYLSIYASSRITDYIRKEVKTSNREVGLVGDEDSPDIEQLAQDNVTPQNYVEIMEMKRLIVNFSKRIMGKDNDIFRLMSEGESSSKIAAELKLEVKYVYKKVYELKRDLKAYLKEEYE